jgi:hypothetical protein
MEILEHPKVEDFQYMDLDDDIRDIGLYVNIDQCSFLEVFNLPEVNQDDLLLIVNSYVINKLSNRKLEDTPSAFINFLEGDYSLFIESMYVNVAIDIPIPRETVKTIFYRILSYGIIPFDSINGYTVKL